MLTILYFLVAGLIGYFGGALPFGYWYVKKTKNVDLRLVSSGRTGGTNAYRAAGLSAGIVTGLGDVLKGAGSIWLAQLAINALAGENWALRDWALALTGVMAVVGHNWSIFLQWRGGAGTTPNVGWATALWPGVFPIAFVVMIGMLLGVGMASVASLTVAVLLPVIFGIRYAMGLSPLAYLLGSIVTALVVTWALRPNIKRIIEGNERVVGPRAKRMENKSNN